MHKATPEATACLREFLLRSIARGVDGIDHIVSRNGDTACCHSGFTRGGHGPF